jgi:deoxyribodipyrimidine photo-lyase
LDKEPELLDMSPMPESNDASIRQNDTFGKLFEATPVPDHIEGFELKDAEKIHEVWPEGTDKAKEVNHLALSPNEY